MTEIDSTSRPPSAPNSEQRDPPIFFLDRALGSRTIADALRLAGAEVRLHRDYFAPDARDEEWLVQVGAWGWFVLTKDAHIHRRKLELAAVRQAQVGLFVLTSGNMTGAAMAAALVNTLPQMQHFALHHTRPFLAKVYKDGSLHEDVLPEEEA